MRYLPWERNTNYPRAVKEEEEVIVVVVVVVVIVVVVVLVPPLMFTEHTTSARNTLIKTGLNIVLLNLTLINSRPM